MERVVGVLRQKYTFLESTLLRNMIMCDDGAELSLIDEVVTVCCALCNYCNLWYFLSDTCTCNFS